jgi:hypothetical protein
MGKPEVNPTFKFINYFWRRDTSTVLLGLYSEIRGTRVYVSPVLLPVRATFIFVLKKQPLSACFSEHRYNT